MNLDEIRKHMQERDFAANGVFIGQLADETRAQANERVLRQLADDVPDLVGAVERANLQNSEWEKMVRGMADRLYAIGKEGEVLELMEIATELHRRCQIIKGEKPLPAAGEKLTGENLGLAEKREQGPQNNYEPRDWQGSFGVKHDMWTGPCSCGAYHREGQ